VTLTPVGWVLGSSSAAARAFHVTKSAGACFGAVYPLPLRLVGMPNPYHTAGDRAVTSRAGQFKNAFVGNDAERSGTSQLSAVPQPSVGRLFKGDGPAGAVSHRGHPALPIAQPKIDADPVALTQPSQNSPMHRSMPARIVSTSRARSASLWPGAFHLVFSITRARFG
jgi:hypothetical protein